MLATVKSRISEKVLPLPCKRELIGALYSVIKFSTSWNTFETPCPKLFIVCPNLSKRLTIWSALKDSSFAVEMSCFAFFNCASLAPASFKSTYFCTALSKSFCRALAIAFSFSLLLPNAFA